MSILYQSSVTIVPEQMIIMIVNHCTYVFANVMSQEHNNFLLFINSEGSFSISFLLKNITVNFNISIYMLSNKGAKIRKIKMFIFHILLNKEHHC